MSSGEQSIRVSDEHWRELNKRKRPGDTFDDVVQRLLNGDIDLDD